MINNAGILRGTSLLKAPLAEIRDELETNLFGIVQFVANT